ncbi:MAG: hypothetical protein R2867_03080 [Caldilineaceae bacterium]
MFDDLTQRQVIKNTGSYLADRLQRNSSWWLTVSASLGTLRKV